MRVPYAPRIVGCQDVPGFDAVAKGEKALGASSNDVSWSFSLASCSFAVSVSSPSLSHIQVDVGYVTPGIVYMVTLARISQPF